MTRPPGLVGLGRLIVTQQKNFTTRAVFTLLLLSGTLMGVLYALFMRPTSQLEESPWPTPVVAVSAVLAGSVYVWGSIFRRVDFHEEALVDHVFFARRVIRYEDVSALDLSFIRQYMNLQYMGIVFRLRLRLTDGRPFQLKDTYLGDHDPIHTVQARIAEVVEQAKFRADARAGRPPRRTPAERGKDVHIGAELSLWNAMTGGKHDTVVMGNAACESCLGTGGSQDEACLACAGQGVVERQRRVLIAFPAGIETGQTLHIPGMGMPGPKGTRPGDLYLAIRIKPHPRFERRGADLETHIQVSSITALRGGQVNVELPNSVEVRVNIPKGTRPGMIKVPGEGIQRFGLPGRGDLIVVVALEGPAESKVAPRN